MDGCLADWLTGCLAGWLAGWLDAWLPVALLGLRKAWGGPTQDEKCEKGQKGQKGEKHEKDEKGDKGNGGMEGWIGYGDPLMVPELSLFSHAVCDIAPQRNSSGGSSCNHAPPSNMSRPCLH